LKAHPTVTIISRDRSTTYAAASTAGAPDAIQVADRFHILIMWNMSLMRGSGR